MHQCRDSILQDLTMKNCVELAHLLAELSVLHSNIQYTII